MRLMIEDDLLVLHVEGALANRTRHHLSFSSVPTTHLQEQPHPLMQQPHPLQLTAHTA